MFATALSTVTGLFSTRFLRNSFFLAFVFVIAACVVVESGRGRLDTTLSTLDGWSTLGKLLGTIALLGVVWLFAAVLESQTRMITQCFEGYWPNSWVKTAGENRYRVELTALRNERRMSEVYWRFPLSENEVMPTRLGNILRACEVYPDDRYGAPGLLVWPRLYSLLPDAMISLIGDSRSALEFLVVLAALASTFAGGSGIYLLVIGGPIWLYLACLLGGSAIAVLAYSASLATARTYAEYVRTAYDLYRVKVIETMNLPRPADPAAELATWEAVKTLLVQNEPWTAPFSYPPPPTP